MLISLLITQNHYWNLVHKASDTMHSLGLSDVVYKSVVGSEATVEKLDRDQIAVAKQRLICYAHANNLSMFDSDRTLYSVKRENQRWSIRLLTPGSEGRWITLYVKATQPWQTEARTLWSTIGLRAPGFSHPSKLRAACRSQLHLGPTSVLLPSDWHLESDVLGLSPMTGETALRWKDQPTTWRVDYFSTELAWTRFAQSQQLIVNKMRPTSSMAKVSGARFGYVSIRNEVIMVSALPAQRPSSEVDRAKDLVGYLSASLRKK